MADILLGIDIGTSACKAAAFRADGSLAAQAVAPYSVSYPAPGWAEQDAEDWWRGACQALRTLFSGGAVRPRDIAAVGVDGQSWATVPVAKGVALTPTPIWMDTRCAGICAELNARFGEDRLFSVSGNPLMPGYATPKYFWMERNRPDALARAEWLLSSNAYIGYKLTGAASLDRSQGYGWSFFDMRAGEYDEALMADMGVRRALMPPIRASHDVLGGVTPDAARESGIPQGTPVVAGALDAACAALGAGALAPGQTQEQGGQAGGMGVCADRPAADKRLILSFHAAPGRWLLQGGTVGGGVMRWMRANFGCESFAEMDAEAARVPAGCEGVTLLPYFAGERSPIWNERAKAVYFGLDYAKTRGHMLRAGLEGTAFALRHNIDAAEEAGARVGDMLATGGAANSRLWTQIKADVTGRRILVPDAENAATLGAAMLAGVACGLYESFERAVESACRVLRAHEPNAGLGSVYDSAYARYRSLYEALRPMM